MPFYAEYLWQAVKKDDDAESVHLSVWPVGGDVDSSLSLEMVKTREFVTLALEARTKADIKVRQPIAEMEITTKEKLSEELLSVIKNEVNVKSVSFKLGDEDERVILDINLTSQLLAEGSVRELMRAVQGKRKSEGLEQHNEIELVIDTDEAGQKAVEDYKSLLVSTVGASSVVFAKTEGVTVVINNINFSFSIKKI